MRFVCFCILSAWSACLLAQVQKAQIIQTYAYQVEMEDFVQKMKDGEIQIEIKSSALFKFLNFDELEGKMERQVVKFNDAYTEFTATPRVLHGYSNSLNTKLKFNFRHMIYELEYIGGANYRIKNATEMIADITQCKFLLQKTLTNLIDARKDFVINLDSQRYFGKVLATRRYLQCTKQ